MVERQGRKGWWVDVRVERGGSDCVTVGKIPCGCQVADIPLALFLSTEFIDLSSLTWPSWGGLSQLRAKGKELL